MGAQIGAHAITRRVSSRPRLTPPPRSPHLAFSCLPLLNAIPQAPVSGTTGFDSDKLAAHKALVERARKYKRALSDSEGTSRRSEGTSARVDQSGMLRGQSATSRAKSVAAVAAPGSLDASWSRQEAVTEAVVGAVPLAPGVVAVSTSSSAAVTHDGGLRHRRGGASLPDPSPRRARASLCDSLHSPICEV